MDKLFKSLVAGIGFVSMIAGSIVASSGNVTDRHFNGCNYTDSLDVDSVVIEEVDWIEIDSIDSDSDWIEFDSIAVETVEIIDSISDCYPEFGTLGKTSASLYAGKCFTVTDERGAEFDFQVNADGVSAKLMEGRANGANDLVIPSSVEALGSYFFVTEIEKFAFESRGNAARDIENSPMRGVRRLIISEGIVSVGQNAFEGARDLKYVELPSSLTGISYMMFANCPKLTSVICPETCELTEIGDFAFDKCISLNSFHIPSQVTAIGQGPWRGCEALEELTLQEGNYDFRVDRGVLYRGWLGELIQYPAGKKEKVYQVMYGTEVIANSAFYGNPHIEKVIMPASLDSISHIAFFDCDSLKDVVFNDRIRVIGNRAFANCPSLKEITLYGAPRYTRNDEWYNTFNAGTKVRVKKEIPAVNVPDSDSGVLYSVFELVSKLPGFETDVMERMEDYGFPVCFGKGIFTVYGNAGPKKDVKRILEAIPASHLVSDIISDDHREVRYYIDRSDKSNPRTLYFFGGTGSNDIVVAFFENGNLNEMLKFMENLKSE